MIHFIIDRYHVGASDAYICAKFLTHLKKGSTDDWSPEKWAEIMHQVVEAHHENQDLYRSVVGGF